MKSNFRSGYVALIGRASVGKSTLLNRLIATNLAITSPKPQTTRHLIRAVVDRQKSQIVVVDSPGLHQPKHDLGRYMMKASRLAISQSDLIVLMIDARFKPYVDQVEQRVLKQARQMEKPVILVINKHDLAKKAEILPLIKAYSEHFNFAEIIPISAKKDENLELLFTAIENSLPQGEKIYLEDEWTDQNERMMAAELVRAECLYLLQDELPHGIGVKIERFEEYYQRDERQKVDIDLVILAEEKSHKGMILGKNGAMLKKIATRSKFAISELLGCRCKLNIFVQVKKNWRSKAAILKDLGYDQNNLQ